MSWISAVTGDIFTQAMLDEVRARIVAAEASIGLAVATSTSNAMTGRALTFADQGGTAYQIIITWQTATPGNIGEVSVVNNSATGATVYNTGLASIAFAYKVVK